MKRKSRRRKRRPRPEPSYVLVFDTETTVDHRQSLTFGIWRYYRVDEDGMHCVDEGVFHADDLDETDPEGMAVLREYARLASSRKRTGPPLRLLNRSEFVEKVLFRVIEAGGRIVGLNLAFDLSRLAIEVTDARGFDRGGHSFVLAKPNPESHHKERKHRPRIAIKHRDAKGSFISAKKAMGVDRDSFEQGRFLDDRTLAFSLTGEAYSLDTACEAFGVQGKLHPECHGEITPDYIDYCRQDVKATAELYESLIAEFQLHPIDLEPERAYSPASLSKAYLEAMGMKPLPRASSELPERGPRLRHGRFLRRQGRVPHPSSADAGPTVRLHLDVSDGRRPHGPPRFHLGGPNRRRRDQP